MKVKRILDVVMFILLLFLMAFFNTGQTVHEVLGILMAICFIIHHVLNRNWYKTVFKGKSVFFLRFAVFFPFEVAFEFLFRLSAVVGQVADNGAVFKQSDARADFNRMQQVVA